MKTLCYDACKDYTILNKGGNRLKDHKQTSKKLKIVLAIVIGVVFLAAAGAYAYTNYFFKSIVSEDSPSLSKPEEPQEDQVNVLFVGVANGLSDTIMLCNFDPKTNAAKIISIPRDTYFPREGYNHPAQKKINAVFGSQGADGLVSSVEGLTGVNINYYLKFDYKTVETVVDALGGLKYTIPRRMDYDDPADDLHIHFPKGTVIEKGSDIVKALRWRKNNDGSGYTDGDIDRIDNQHKIVQLGIDRLLSGNIPLNIVKVQKPIMNDIKTNMPPDQIIYYMTKLNDINPENIEFSTLPGVAEYVEGLSFFLPNKEKMAEIFLPMKSN